MSGGACCATGGRACPAVGIGSVVLLGLRLFVGGVFVFAASVKLGDPQQFAFGIEAYRLIPNEAEHLVMLGAFVVPWLELIVGAMLVLGLWGRSAALVATSLMALFVYAVWSVIARDLDVTCACFGKLKGPFGCEGPIGTCKLAENATLLATALVVACCGPGRIAVDALFRRGS